ncbi:MaoC family dehydratase N-terminal domain-containing protein [Nocardia sp. NPDC002869]|uniref:FAS1-like dehydratase domain-containing protein n=1 Tax=Nocardia sp. NPDC002869 TaxID=3161032 RepID=UPI00398CF1F2
MSADDTAVSGTRESPSAPGPGLPVGYRYRPRDHYVVGREKIREFARAVQDHHPAHWSEDAGTEYGYGGLIAPLTFFSVPGFLAQSEMFASVMTGYDLSQIMQTDQLRAESAQAWAAQWADAGTADKRAMITRALRGSRLVVGPATNAGPRFDSSRIRLVDKNTPRPGAQNGPGPGITGDTGPGAGDGVSVA